MDVKIHHFKLIPAERYVKDLKWKIAQAKSAVQANWLLTDGTASSHCICRPSYKLKCIDATNRSIQEQDIWTKVLETAAKHARIRAVQMHFQVVTDLTALPYTIQCCERRQAKSVAVARVALTTDEHERTWIYDSGAARCMIGQDHLTEDERKRVYSIPIETYTTAAGLIYIDKAVICNVPYFGKRVCYIAKTCPPVISVKEDVDHYGNVFIYDSRYGP